MIFWKIPASGMKTKRPQIRVVAASVTGAQHLHRKTPCQDCYKHTRGRNFVAVVSDGAGSAKFGKIGARVICETLCDILKNSPFSEIRGRVFHAIKIAREKLMRHRFNRSKNEDGIADFAATIVGVVYHGSRGLFFHIGDGAAIAFPAEAYENFIASRPENGNFSCETFFFTQRAWAENLRFTAVEDAETVFLMSDGLTGFSFSNSFQEIEKGFLVPINTYLKDEKVKAKAVRALANTLKMPRAQRLNSDDKTLLWAKVK